MKKNKSKQEKNDGENVILKTFLLFLTFLLLESALILLICAELGNVFTNIVLVIFSIYFFPFVISFVFLVKNIRCFMDGVMLRKLEKNKLKTTKKKVKDSALFDSEETRVKDKNSMKNIMKNENPVDIIYKLIRTGSNSKSIENVKSYVYDFIHELKNPLTVIRMNAELLECGNFSEEDIKNSANVIMNTVRSVSDLLFSVKDNLKLIDAYTESGYKVVKRLDLDVFLDNKLLKLREMYPNVEISFISDGKEHFIYADKNDVDCIIDNLVDNATGFAEKIIISLLYYEQFYKDNDIIIINVEDSGSGINKNERNRVFDRFYTNRSDKVKTEHSGLGLTNVKIVVENLGGSVSVGTSKKLHGAKFCVKIPADGGQKKRSFCEIRAVGKALQKLPKK